MTASIVCDTYRVVADGLAQHLALVPDDLAGLDEPLWSGTFQKDGGPIDETGMSLRQLLVHTIVATCEVPVALGTGIGFEPVKAASAELSGKAPSELAAEFTVRRAKLIAWLESLGDEAMAATIATPLGEAPRAAVLLRAALHAMHHKGQVMTAMRQFGLRTGRIF